jgi:hypothetical protein
MSSTFSKLPQQMATNLMDVMEGIMRDFSQQGSNDGSVGETQANEQQPIAPNCDAASIDTSSFEFYDTEAFRPGTIFGAFHHEPHFPPQRPNLASINLTRTKFGDIHSKFRKFVVISRQKASVIALPIYTHRGTGLARKYNKDEFVGIREVDYMETEGPEENLHGIVWVQQNPVLQGKSGWYRMNDMASISFLAPSTFHLGQGYPKLGQLILHSTVRLQRLFRDSLWTLYSKIQMKGESFSQT